MDNLTAPSPACISLTMYKVLQGVHEAQVYTEW